MNSNKNAISYEKSLQIFRSNEAQLPQQIRFKLNYISQLLKGQSFKNTIDNLTMQYQLQIQDLKDVNQKGLKIIFTSIVQTLFNSDITIDKQCYIRRRGFFKSWVDAFIKYDDTYIYFNYSNKTSRYRFKNIQIKLNSSSKRAFDFYYKADMLMTIKFEKAQSMQLMHKTIKNQIFKQQTNSDLLMKQSLQKKPQQKQNTLSTLFRRRTSKALRSQKKPPKQKVIQDPQQKQTRIMQFQKSIISQVETQIINRRSSHHNERNFALGLVEENYQVRYTFKNVFIAIHKLEPKLMLQIIVKVQYKQLGLAHLLSALALYKNWNTKIIKEQIKYIMKSHHKAIIYRVYQKGSSLLSKQRETYTILQYQKLTDNSAILVQETLDNQDVKEEFTRAYLKTVFLLQIIDTTAKISIQSEYDPKGYCSKSEAQDLLYNIYQDIIHFQNYISQLGIKNHKSSQLFLFQQFQDSQTNKSQQNIKQNVKKASKSLQDMQDDKSSDQQAKQTEKANFEIYRRSTNKNPFNQLRLFNPTKIPTHQYLELIKKRQFERYYLKCHFNQQKVISRYDSYLPWYCLQEMLKKGGQYEITQNMELKFVNQKLIQSQKDILRYVIKQIGANLISGKSVLNVSLPVDIFQPRTLLQRSAASLGKCPDYLLRSCESSPLSQIMNVTSFLASVPSLQLVMQKPFNPILGQTFQCYLKGIPLCYEQISHHPPISSYFMECSEFKMYGNLIAFADVGLNSGVGGNLGVMHVVFKNVYHYQCYFPPSEISGLIYGDRKFRSYGKGYILERNQLLFAQFSIQKYKKGVYQSKDKLTPGSIIGGIFKVNKKFIEFLNSYNNNLKKFPGISKQHITQKLVDISGIWFDKIYMNGNQITQGVRAYPVQYSKNNLPSDANFRLDVLYHKQNNLPESQKQKEILQNIQRDDRKMREKYQKQKQKYQKQRKK